MIVREWGATVSVDREEEYLERVRARVLDTLASHDGYRGATFARRSDGEHVRYQVVSYWNSWEAVRTLAGDETDVAYVPEEIASLLIDYDKFVRHYEVVVAHQLQRLGEVSSP